MGSSRITSGIRVFLRGALTQRRHHLQGKAAHEARLRRAWTYGGMPTRGCAALEPA